MTFDPSESLRTRCTRANISLGSNVHDVNCVFTAQFQHKRFIIQFSVTLLADLALLYASVIFNLRIEVS